MKNNLFFFLLIFLVSCQNEEAKEINTTKPIAKKVEVLTELQPIEKLFIRKNFNNRDMLLKDYKKSKINQPDSIRRYIYIVPFGNMRPEVEEIIYEEIVYLSIFFQLPVRISGRVSFDDIKKMESVKTRMVPDSDHEYYSKEKGNIENLREQIEANSFIEHYLRNNRPMDAVAVLGITEHDIYNPNYNYLFGTSYKDEGVGLVSTYRLIDYRESTKHNIRKVISKQIANMFSISNVKDYECLLNFYNSKEALENGIFEVSPVALEKLKYAIGFDHLKRFNELKDFWSRENHSMMIEFYENCIKLLSE